MPAIVIVPVRRHIVQRKTESAFGISTFARECLLGRKGSKKHDLACGQERLKRQSSAEEQQQWKELSTIWLPRQ